MQKERSDLSLRLVLTSIILEMLTQTIQSITDSKPSLGQHRHAGCLEGQEQKQGQPRIGVENNSDEALCV